MKESTMIIKLYQLHELHWLAIHLEGPEYIFREMDESGMGWVCVQNGGVDFADCFDNWRSSCDTKWPSLESFLSNEFLNKDYIRKLVDMAESYNELWETYVVYRLKKEIREMEETNPNDKKPPKASKIVQFPFERSANFEDTKHQN